MPGGSEIVFSAWVDVGFLVVSGMGFAAALVCVGQALKLSDDIWHRRRARVGPFVLVAIALMFVSLGLAWMGRGAISSRSTSSGHAKEDAGVRTKTVGSLDF